MDRIVTRAPIGFGCMRLSTARDRNEARGVETIRAALDAGATLLDTADAYALDDSDVGHNERLIARALSEHDGDRDAVRVATKGGLTRPRGRWVPNGKASHLLRACEASLQALGVDRIDLYQLHAPDPRVPLATSVRALADLKERGLIDAIGLCNVNRTQLEQALDIADIAAVQIELSWFADDAIRGGVVEYCATHGIEVIAHSPLGGGKRAARLAKQRVLRQVAGAHDASAADVALAYLRDLSRSIAVIPGATSPERARALCRAQTLELTADDRVALDAEYEASAILRKPRDARAPRGKPRARVALIMGIPGAGKSTVARELEQGGYLRLNRDTRGGTLAGLAKALGEQLANGESQIVVDNTYPTRAQRSRIIETAWGHGAVVTCQWIDTPLKDAQINAVLRMLRAHGRLLAGDELKTKVLGDDTVYLPEAQFRYRRAFEPPSIGEGFESIKQTSFEREWGAEFVESATIVQLHDDTLDKLASVVAETDGLILGTAWLPKGTDDDRAAWLAAAFEALGAEFPVEVCIHGEGPPRCWCRKPLPGLGVKLVLEHRLDPGRCVHVGRRPADRTWAERLGFRYVDIKDV